MKPFDFSCANKPCMLWVDNHSFPLRVNVLSNQCSHPLYIHHYNVFRYFHEILFLSEIDMNSQTCQTQEEPKVKYEVKIF